MKPTWVSKLPAGSPSIRSVAMFRPLLRRMRSASRRLPAGTGRSETIT